ncbi:RNA 2',3'-cyclic phosphodiesterase [Streptomyces sp. NPDC051567]|uniref:RNA 2',3'-cyclic phosphodiesterase n=1 Tax=Streptomyces sp. NPDC051567 TaxID=3365660 RepID=UPI00378FFA01
MRLFVAVVPPETVVTELAEALREARAGQEERAVRDSRLRWSPEAGWHLTLAFLGEVRDEVLPELRARLARAALETAPFALRLHGCGHFGGRALWAGVAGDLDGLRILAERADAAARRAGVPMEQPRRYTPHLTLARSRDSNRAEAWSGEEPGAGTSSEAGAGASTEAKAGTEAGTSAALRPYLEALAGFEGSAWPAAEIRLVHSHIGGEPRYETLVAWPLGG